MKTQNNLIKNYIPETNKEKRKKYYREYYLKNREKINEKNKLYYRNNKDKYLYKVNTDSIKITPGRFIVSFD